MNKKLVSIYLSDDKTHYKKLYEDDLNEYGYCTLKYDELDRKKYKLSEEIKFILEGFQQLNDQYSIVLLKYDMLRANIMKKYNLTEEELNKLEQLMV